MRDILLTSFKYFPPKPSQFSQYKPYFLPFGLLLHYWCLSIFANYCFEGNAAHGKT